VLLRTRKDLGMFTGVEGFHGERPNARKQRDNYGP